MRTLILTLLVLIAAPSVAMAKLHKRPGDLPGKHALKKGVDPQNPKPKFKLLHKHGGGGHGHGLFHKFHR